MTHPDTLAKIAAGLHALPNYTLRKIYAYMTHFVLNTSALACQAIKKRDGNYSHKLGKLVKREKMIDKDRNEYVERVRAFQDKHIAHSVNAFEDTKVQARYCEERVQQEGITGVSTAHYRVMGLSSRDVDDVIELCKALLVYVDAKIEEEKKRLLSILRSLPIAEVLTRPSSPVLMPDHSKIGKRRARP